MDASSELSRTANCLNADVKAAPADKLVNSNIKFSQKRSTSNMGVGNKHSRTANCWNTNDKFVQIDKLANSNVKLSLQKKNVTEDIKCTLKTDFESSDIDLILDHRVIKNQLFYLVKRKNQRSQCSVWEPAEKLLGYPNVLYYHQVILHSLELLNEDTVFYFVNDLVTRQPQDLLTLTKLCALIYSCTEEVIRGLKLTFEELKVKALRVLEIPIERLNKKRLSLCHLMRFSEARKRVLWNCAEWERQINRFSPSYVRVENEVDLEEPPIAYRFISDYESAYVDLQAHPVLHCECGDCSVDSCCAQVFGGRFAYDAQGRLQLPPGHEIYECNSLCRCDQSCSNRVVQRGPTTPLSIFRTSNNRGWGLRALATLPRGTFVLEYLGEVISPMDADVRDQAYDYTGATYLFDLSSSGREDGRYTVDAGHRGNASRFINHSCDPNLQVYCVWGEQQDPGLPRLAFFTRWEVGVGEELTFDYKMQEGDYLQGEGDRMQCKCGSRNCRKYLF